ncbi:rhamnulokinase [Enterococcus sp. 5H]|uniref:rhamnulokinase n=1 Tax=Enterococcus sp. 5H TaxID=1229490 RepID=UPI0023049EEC|nr:rhamnulokinase family protein [Enterococcus sp. 5H]MDA9472522.1 Rhamnulokinase [Enterococcus sp. 5H]
MEMNVVAIDLGGSSGRVVLGKFTDDHFTLKEVHRFKEYTIQKNGYLYWDIHKIFQEIAQGLKIAKTIAPDFQSIGIDTWGVDFGLVAKDGSIKLPFSYRDRYTVKTYSKIQKQLGKRYLFEKTGLQTLPINSLFQLAAQNDLQLLDQTQFFLMIPDLLNYMLTGIAKTELSIASTTQLLDPDSNQWNRTLIQQIGLPQNIFPEIVTSGNFLGKVKANAVSKLPLENINVINVAAHDTASAVYSIPELKDHLFISSGTWSLLGMEIDQPLITKEILLADFSNEKSASGKTLLLKNLTGLWLIEEAIKDFRKSGELFDYEKIADLITKSSDTQQHFCYFDTDDRLLALPGDIIKKIQHIAEETQQNKPETPREIFESIYRSLACKYRYTIEKLAKYPELKIKEKQLVIIGGGSKSEILCQYTANVLNKEVKSGLAEATAIGNCMMQFEVNGAASRGKLEQIIGQTTKFNIYKPTEVEKWEADYLVYTKVMEGLANELSENRNSSNN